MPGLSQWTAATADIANGDLFAITDINDPDQSVNGSSKKVTFSQLLSSIHKRIYFVPSSSGSVSLDCSLYHTFVITVTSAMTITFLNFEAAQEITVVTINGGSGTKGGSYITWPSTVKWPEGSEADLSTAEDRLTFQKLSATKIHGTLVGQRYA